MKQKHIEASRELRLWIGQVIVPTAVAVGGLLAIPEVREAVKAKARSIKHKIDTKIKKKESK